MHKDEWLAARQDAVATYPGGHGWAEVEQEAANGRPPAADECVLCGHGPARNTVLRQVTGLVFWLSWQTVNGPFCRDCGVATFRAMTSRTLVTGWWGVVAFPFNLYTVARNLVSGRRVAALDVPRRLEPVAAPLPAPLDPGPSLPARPGTWVGVVVVAAVALLFGVDLLAQADRDATGSVVGAGDLSAVDLRSGDCFDDPGSDDVVDVRALPCDQEHDYEVFLTFDLRESGTYPSEDARGEEIGQRCLPAFDTFVGTAYEESELDIYTLEPTADSWDAGDREVVCAVARVDGAKLTGSARDSGL
jgi:hypothetical protein